jgi:hypothetical protein
MNGLGFNCSSTQVSLLTLLPSTWWPAVAAPQRKPLGMLPAGAADSAARAGVATAAAPSESSTRRETAMESVIKGPLESRL